jgi:multiple sugar transport system substrate-binding protein
MLHRTRSAVVTALLASACLVACTSSPQTPPPSSTTGGSTAAPPTGDGGTGSATAGVPTGSGDPTPTSTTPAPVQLTIALDSAKDGADAATAKWVTEYVIPEFTKLQQAAGTPVEVRLAPAGSKSADYRAELLAALGSGSGPDVFGFPAGWLGDLTGPGYLKPLSEVPGADAGSWDGWAQIPEGVQAAGSVGDARYAVPVSIDGRVLFFNKALLAEAGLPRDWKPRSWADITSAAKALKKVDGVTPLQLDAGTAMAETTTLDGVLPLLAGTGAELYTDGKWLGDSPQVRAILSLYNSVYNVDGLGDPVWQLDPAGLGDAYAAFAAGKVGILIGTPDVWTTLDPKSGTAKMPNRDKDVGYGLIPAQKAGSGIGGADQVSVSTGSLLGLNAAGPNAALAWQLLTFMTSADALKSRLGRTAAITSRTDVNTTVLAKNPLLKYVAEKAIPVTTFPPAQALYPYVSVALQRATSDVVAGATVEQAAANYQKALEGIVGKENVRSK